MRRRRSDLELCFDSMTDLITNLAGGLVLVVLLLMGVTREARPVAASRPDDQPESPAARSIRPLDARFVELRGAAEEVSADVDRYNRELDRLSREAAALLAQADPQPPDKK